MQVSEKSSDETFSTFNVASDTRVPCLLTEGLNVIFLLGIAEKRLRLVAIIPAC